MKVYKNTVKMDDQVHSFELPEDAEILHVAEQHGGIAFWFEQPSSDVELDTELRSFQVFGTGHWVPDTAIYQGTVLLSGGSIVVHLYEIV